MNVTDYIVSYLQQTGEITPAPHIAYHGSYTTVFHCMHVQFGHYALAAVG